MPPVSIMSTTLCYPRSDAPIQGLFVQRRLREIHRLKPLTVIAPVPWFPGARRPPHSEDRGGPPPAVRPRMFYLPGVAKSLDARFFARALDRAIEPLQHRKPVRLIDVHFVWPDGVGAWRVARRRRIPLLCTIRGKLVSRIAEPSQRRQITAMLRDADGLIAVSRALANLANDVAGRDLAIRVIPNGIDPSLFGRAGGDTQAWSATARAACGWSDAARYVVSVGHLQALKGFHHLLNIWPEVRRRAGDARLVLVGGATGERAYAARIRNQAASLGPEAVTLVGPIAPDRVATMLNAADLFVLASRSEGWCNAIAESLACGCPVVATDVGGNREIVTDDALGALVPCGDTTALTDAVCAALDRSWDRDHIATIGGRRTWQEVAAECVDVMENVLRRTER